MTNAMTGAAGLWPAGDRAQQRRASNVSIRASLESASSGEQRRETPEPPR